MTNSLSSARRLNAGLFSPCLLGLTVALAVGGCSFGPRLSAEQRETQAGCRSEADRVYNTQNRYQLSERDSTDNPLSGTPAPIGDTNVLSDQYQHANLVDECLHRSAAVPANPAATP